MSIFRHDTLGSWTRGGQAIVHNVRMTTQVFFQTLLAGLAIWIGGTLWYALEKSSAFERFVLMKLGQATLMGDAVPGNVTPILFKTPQGQQYWTSPRALIDSGLAHKTLHAFEVYLIHGAALSGLFALVTLGWAWFYFTRTGKGLGSNQFLRGARFGTARQVRRALWRSSKGSFDIGGVNVPDAFEPEHILICGAPGTGKTNIIVKMLDGIRKRRRRAIVYDTAGTFVEKFYRPGIDVLLNPLDARADCWSPWVDVPRDYHYDQIAESTIPDKAGDPFWAKAARGTLVAVMRKLARQERTLVSILLDTLLRSRLKDLAAFAAGTDAAAFISTEGERTSAGIQAELASVMRSFSYLDDTADGFSIRDWVANERDDSWLFITVKADQLPSLRPLITVWLDIAISAIMSMTPDRNRRLYCVIDELPTLQRLPSLGDFLARARKYGGCGILGFQSYPQLEATYGIQDAAAITGYCSTWVALRANDTPTAKHVSENLGQVEQVEANEGMSYGVNDMRDGVNLSRMQVTRPLVMHTEVTNLPNLTGYLRFGRNLPVVRFEDGYNKVVSIAEAFEERTGTPLRMIVSAEPSPPAAPVPATPERPKATPPRRRRTAPKAKEAELPLLTPAENQASDDRTADKDPTSGSDAPEKDGKSPSVPPPLELYGKPAGFRLKQHGRRDGARNSSRPA
ncbi:type IV secretion system DNA-binding domain-containing protein [Novosphingobium profundi]|uniref:type IV secretion system DNA-binding domain-containing protein n=1 Tax=Novosphingobium profundi TaxID=1774954 RepID=UPI001BDA488D|nr:type IV secretion system DNA-binding domain-containing protein [Novosphingobium profundi]MBT0667432.1 type IV secretion system DNA-binding domain-containing protein [Novosphingobium profundi]